MIVAEPPEDGMTKSMPEPTSETDCGLSTAVSVRMRVPVRVPDEVGVKVSWMAQVPPSAATLLQLLVCAKSPVVRTLAMVRTPLPELVTVMVWTLLAVPTVSAVKSRLEALRCATPAIPVPLRLTMCGFP